MANEVGFLVVFNNYTDKIAYNPPPVDPTPPYEGLLDSYGGAAAAYSVRRLSGSYNGPAITLRVDDGVSDPEYDIGFDASGNLDVAGIASYCGSNNGYLATWFDQSGNSYDATQTTAANQPQIYNGTAVITENGKPAMQLTGTNQSLFAGLTNSNGSLSIFCCGYFSMNNTWVFLADLNFSSPDGIPLIFDSTSGGRVAAYRAPTGYTSQPITGVSAGQHLGSNIYIAGTGSTLGHNGTTASQDTTAQGTVAWNYSSTSQLFKHQASGTTRAQELVLYHSDESSNRIGIESNISDHYFGPDRLLNTYEGAAAGYSVRKINKYATLSMRVRRDSDDAEQDFGFDASGNLDVAGIESFCGNAIGYLATWFDQSGNSRNATQTTTADQPQIYNGTAVLTRNSKPAAVFDGSSDYMDMPDSMLPSNINNCSVFTVQTNESSPNGATFNIGGYGINDRWFQTIVVSNVEYFGYGSSFAAINIGAATTSQRLITAIAGSTQGNAQCFVDGTSQGSVALQSATPTTGTGELGRTDYLGNGTFQEVIVYHSDQSSNRSGIESNANTYFNIFE